MLCQELVLRKKDVEYMYVTMQGPQCRGGGGPAAPARCEDVPEEAGVEREDDFGEEEELGLCLVLVASTFIPKYLSGIM